MNQRLYVQVEPSVSDNIVICIPTKGDTPDYSAIYITKLTPLGSLLSLSQRKATCFQTVDISWLDLNQFI